MDMPLIPPITTKELHLFHRMDRELFCLLIYKLRRDVTQSLLIMALWLWLENVGYHNLIPRVGGLPNILVNALANEGVACLKCLETDDVVIPNGGGLPLTKMLVKKDISLEIFKLKRYTAIVGIKSVLNNICARIFNDVLQIVLKSKNVITSRSTTSRTNTLNMPLVLTGFPHPLFGTFDLSLKLENLSLSDQTMWGLKTPIDDATDDDKSMFLTFSRGFHVSEIEVRYLFTSLYGDCVQGLTMGRNVKSSQQHLFAIMVLKSVVTVDRILVGKHVVKLQINRKHVWVRKFERRD